MSHGVYSLVSVSSAAKRLIESTCVICRKYAEVQHLSSMSEANYKKVMIESESIRVLCVCVALLSIS